MKLILDVPSVFITLAVAGQGLRVRPGISGQCPYWLRLG